MLTWDRVVLFWFLVLGLVCLPWNAVAGQQQKDLCYEELLSVRRSHKTFSLRADSLVEVHWTQTVRARRESWPDEKFASVRGLCVTLSEYEADRLVAFTGVKARLVAAKGSVKKDLFTGSKLVIRPRNESIRLSRAFIVERYPIDEQPEAAQPLALLQTADDIGDEIEIELSYLLVRSVCPLPFVKSAKDALGQANSLSKDVLLQRYRFHMDMIGVKSVYPVEEQQFRVLRQSLVNEFRSRLVGVPEGLVPAEIRALSSAADERVHSNTEPDFAVEYGPYFEADRVRLTGAFIDLSFDTISGVGPGDIALSAMTLAGTFRALTARRELAVSHRGRLQVKETLTLLNDYPEAREGAWSRLDYLIILQKDSFATRTIQEFLAVIPLAARQIFYRDITGNISTSAFRPLAHLLAPLEQFRKGQTPDGKRMMQALSAKRNTHQVLVLRPRFPLAPSWRTNIEFGYEMPLRGQSHWEHLGGDVFVFRHALTPPFHGLIVDDLDLQVVLPNAAKVLHVETPGDRHWYHVSIEHQSGYGHLDFVPRTIVRIRRNNVVTDLSPPTNGQFEIRYTVGKFQALWLKPLIILGYVLIALVSIVFVPRMKLRIQEK
ncbi:hypothetical protein CCYA_CCYA10G2801 [Cyanidiococcus yangmingshanensis]|nr:hypothetical protein CCYA_CCYA10G2801 [Cyanidiococcus yangmingshanensis]